jgi:single-strand DNA-binding protein
MIKVTITGNLTADPDLRSVKEAACANYSVACDTRKKDPEGNKITNYFRVTAWRFLGEFSAKYLKKGDKVCVHGDLMLQEYVDGQGIKRTSMQVTATDVELMSTRQKAQDATSETAQADSTAPDEEELPF